MVDLLINASSRCFGEGRQVGCQVPTVCLCSATVVSSRPTVPSRVVFLDIISADEYGPRMMKAADTRAKI